MSSTRIYRWIHSATHQRGIGVDTEPRSESLTATARPVPVRYGKPEVPASQPGPGTPRVEPQAMAYGFGGAGIGAELAISHLPPCLTIVLM